MNIHLKTESSNNKSSKRFKNDFQETSRPYKISIQTNTAGGEENKLQQSIYKNEIQRTLMELEKQINKNVKPNKFLKNV